VSALTTAEDSDVVTTIEDLEALYGELPPGSDRKVTARVTPLQRRYVEESPFVLLATVGPEGADCSPRGDAPGFVRVVDDGATLLMPDRRGNNRIDSLRNIVRDGRVGLLFLVPGLGVTLRVNGRARLLTDPARRASFTVAGKIPATVVEVTVNEAYTQCPKAVVRSGLWDPHRFRSPEELPSVGSIMAEITAGEVDGEAYDAAYPERLRRTLY
jgi:hypothetical protein